MSKTVFVQFRGDGFWAYDVVSSVLANFMVAAANKIESHNTWLSESIHSWRINAVVSEYGFHLADDWSADQIEVVRKLCVEASESIRKLGDFDAETVESWPQIDGGKICTRGHDIIPAEPVAKLGDAIVALLDGDLPDAPESHWWFYGLNDVTGTIKMGARKTDG